MPETDKLVELIKTYRRVFNSDDGKQVLEDLKKRCYFNVSTFSADPYIHAFNEGTRATLFSILNMLEMDIDKLLELGGTDASSKSG